MGKKVPKTTDVTELQNGLRFTYANTKLNMKAQILLSHI